MAHLLLVVHGTLTIYGGSRTLSNRVHNTLRYRSVLLTLFRRVQGTLQKGGVLNTLKSGVLRDTGLGHYLRCAAPTSLLRVHGFSVRYPQGSMGFQSETRRVPKLFYGFPVRNT